MITAVKQEANQNYSIAEPSYSLKPGYILSTALIDTEVEKNIPSLVGLALNKAIWGNFTESRKKQVIEEHKFIYIKINEKNEILEIGMHVEQCKTIEKIGIKRLMLGKRLLTKDISIVAMPPSSYANMIKKMVPELV